MIFNQKYGLISELEHSEPVWQSTYKKVEQIMPAKSVSISGKNVGCATIVDILGKRSSNPDSNKEGLRRVSGESPDEEELARQRWENDRKSVRRAYTDPASFEKELSVFRFL